MQPPQSQRSPRPKLLCRLDQRHLPRHADVKDGRHAQPPQRRGEARLDVGGGEAVEGCSWVG
jgi:hypothetical protein